MSDYEVGDRVELKAGKKRGQILIIIDGGEGKYKNFPMGKFYGIRLENDGDGVSDGRYKNEGEYYFRCPKNSARFDQGKDIVGKIEADFDFTNETTEIEAAKAKDDEKYDKASEKINEFKAKFKAIDDGSGDKEEKGDGGLNQAEFTKFACSDLGVDEAEGIKLFKTIDVSGNGSISFAEFHGFFKGGGGQSAIDKLKKYAALKKAFKDADKDGNLSLDAAEFTKLAQEAMQLKEYEAKVLFIAIDTNENGSISFDEFEAYVDDIGGEENFGNYRKLIDEFNDADKDNSGELSKEEFVKLLKDKLKYNKFQAQRIFTSIDSNKDESLSLKEFEAWVGKIGGAKALSKK